MVKPRPARPTVKCVDTYCELYKDLFGEVRAYECFKYLHLGLISDIKRKSLPVIAKIVGLENEQGLLHFLSESPWKAEKLGKIENGIASVNAYGYCEGMTWPLKFKVFKPIERLKEGDKCQTKPELGAELVRELRQRGFNIKRVLADSFYGESRSNFISVLEELGIEYAVAIRSNHGVWLPRAEKVRANKWREFEHIRWDGKKETRSIREIIYGKRRAIQSWEITTDKENLAEAESWFVMTRIAAVKYKEVGAIYGVRTWVEYGFKQCKNELGWADFRGTHYPQIQK